MLTCDAKKSFSLNEFYRYEQQGNELSSEANMFDSRYHVMKLGLKPAFSDSFSVIMDSVNIFLNFFLPET